MTNLNLHCCCLCHDCSAYSLIPPLFIFFLSLFIFLLCQPLMHLRPDMKFLHLFFCLFGWFFFVCLFLFLFCFVIFIFFPLTFWDSLKFLSLLTDKEFTFRHVDASSDLTCSRNDTVNFKNC